MDKPCTVCLSRGKHASAIHVAAARDGTEWFECGDHGPRDFEAQRVASVPIEQWRLRFPVGGCRVTLSPMMNALPEPPEWTDRVETRTSLCPGCGTQLKPDDALRCLEFALSQDTQSFSELATGPEMIDIDFQQARVWLCVGCASPIMGLMDAVRGTVFKVTGRSS